MSEYLTGVKMKFAESVASNMRCIYGAAVGGFTHEMTFI